MTRTSWWLEGGELRCPVCLQRYALQVEVRCVECDRGTCPFCAVTVTETREIVCLDCAPAPAPARGG